MADRDTDIRTAKRTIVKFYGGRKPRGEFSDTVSFEELSDSAPRGTSRAKLAGIFRALSADIGAALGVSVTYERSFYSPSGNTAFARDGGRGRGQYNPAAVTLENNSK